MQPEPPTPHSVGMTWRAREEEEARPTVTGPSMDPEATSVKNTEMLGDIYVCWWSCPRFLLQNNICAVLCYTRNTESITWCIGQIFYHILDPTTSSFELQIYCYNLLFLLLCAGVKVGSGRWGDLKIGCSGAAWGEKIYFEIIHIKSLFGFWVPADFSLCSCCDSIFTVIHKM